jgi:hypothetical protein
MTEPANLTKIEIIRHVYQLLADSKENEIVIERRVLERVMDAWERDSRNLAAMCDSPVRSEAELVERIGAWQQRH